MKVDTSKFVFLNEGKDRIVGRPIELNRVTLATHHNFAELLLFGDLHYGHPQCDEVKARDMLAWAKKENVYILLMGDLIEVGLRESVGDSIYRQKLHPQEQMEAVEAMFEPVKHLIIGLHRGNHETRIFRLTGIDISKLMAKHLGVRYLEYSCWSLLKVGNQHYSMYSTHGHSGARFKHTKLKAIVDLTGWISADIVAMGHVHTIAAEPIMRQKIYHHQVVEEKNYVVLTGSYLRWNKTYAEDAGYPITRIGSPRAKLLTNEHDIHFRL